MQKKFIRGFTHLLVATLAVALLLGIAATPVLAAADDSAAETETVAPTAENTENAGAVDAGEAGAGTENPAPRAVVDGWYVYDNPNRTLQTMVDADLALTGKAYVDVTKQRITGAMDDIDFQFIRENLSGLEELDLSGMSNTALPMDAFFNCTSLVNITLPEGLTTIGGKAFLGCTGLARLTFPEGAYHHWRTGVSELLQPYRAGVYPGRCAHAGRECVYRHW